MTETDSVPGLPSRQAGHMVGSRNHTGLLSRKGDLKETQMIRRIVLVAGALLVASVWFGSAAHAGSYTPPSSDPPAVSPSGQVSGQADPAGVASSGQLPQTGSDTTESLLRIGIVLVVCGGVLAFAATRRRASSTSS